MIALAAPLDRTRGVSPLGAPLVSYAQNFEDVLLARVFNQQNHGFYLDIGAYDPEIGSVTKAFYDRGWRGINIEPGPIFARLAANRPEDINLEIAVTDYTGEVGFIDDPSDPGLSRLSAPDARATPQRMIACDTLTRILATHGEGRTPDFIKIDAEGAESAIINSTDWRAIRPSVLLIEATPPWTNEPANQSWEAILHDYGYQRAYFDGINMFYIPVERADLQRHFTLPVNALDHFVMYNQALATLQRDLLDSQRAFAASEVIATALRAERAALAGQLAEAVADHQVFRDRLAIQLEWPDAPRPLRVSLGLARFLRHLRLPRTQASAPLSTGSNNASLAARPTRSPLKALLLFTYRPLRPIVRPIAWRLRWFLVGDIRHDLARLNERLDRQTNHAFDAGLAHDQACAHASAQAQTDQLIGLVETALLTLALEAERLAAERR